MTGKQILNRYKDSDKICPICNKYVQAQDIEDLQYIYSRTKLKKNIFAHKKCLRKRKVK